MTQVAVWANPHGGVCVCWPAQGIEAEAAARASAPEGVSYFLKDSDALPLDHPQERWSLDGAGNITVSSGPELPPELARSQIMRQLNADGKLVAARAAIATADPLSQELWVENSWRLSAVQQEPFASMIAALSIDVPTFWAAAAQQPA